MKNEQYVNSFDKIDPDESAQARIFGQVLSRAKPVKFTAIKRAAFASLAACLVVAVTAVLLNVNNNNVGSGDFSPPQNSAAPTQSFVPQMNIDAIKGLPAWDYTWTDDVQTNREAFNDIEGFVRNALRPREYTKQAIAIVSVRSVRPIKYGLWNNTKREGQIATVAVHVSTGDEIEEKTLELEQYVYAGCMNSEKTNLLRVGGVYVVPLYKYYIYDDAEWRIGNDLDALFEVDNKNLIHTHSKFEKVKLYNNKPLSKLWGDIKYFIENPELLNG